jgi:hypothetical protein
MVEKLILLIIGQAGLGILALVRLWFSNERLKERVKEIEEENAEFRKALKELSDTLLIVKNNTELLVLGKLKTAGK